MAQYEHDPLAAKQDFEEADDVSQYADSLALSQAVLARARHGLGDLDAASEHVSRAIEAQRHAVELNPDTLIYRTRLAEHLELEGELATRSEPSESLRQ